MEKFTNKQGYLLALIVATIYSLIMEKHFELLGFIANFIAIIVISSILGGIVMLIFGSKNFGKFLGITTLIISVLSFAGNRLYENEERKKVIDEIIKVKQEESNINLIISNFEKAYAEFNEKLKNDSRKDILNKILISNEIFIGDTKTVLEKINQADEYYGWIKTTNDSLISDIKEQLAKYQNGNSNETEILKIQFDLVMMDSNFMMNNINTGNVIFSMRNLIGIKNRCKHEHKNGQLLFLDNKCLEEWKKGELKLNEAIQNLNKHRENLINK